jgi:hypothetical protein
MSQPAEQTATLRTTSNATVDSQPGSSALRVKVCRAELALLAPEAVNLVQTAHSEIAPTVEAFDHILHPLYECEVIKVLTTDTFIEESLDLGKLLLGG